MILWFNYLKIRRQKTRVMEEEIVVSNWKPQCAMLMFVLSDSVLNLKLSKLLFVSFKIFWLCAILLLGWGYTNFYIDFYMLSFDMFKDFWRIARKFRILRHRERSLTMQHFLNYHLHCSFSFFTPEFNSALILGHYSITVLNVSYFCSLFVFYSLGLFN